MEYSIRLLKFNFVIKISLTFADFHCVAVTHAFLQKLASCSCAFLNSVKVIVTNIKFITLNTFSNQLYFTYSDSSLPWIVAIAVEINREEIEEYFEPNTRLDSKVCSVALHQRVIRPEMQLLQEPSDPRVLRNMKKLKNRPMLFLG